MNDMFKYYAREVASGKMDRRAFLGKAAAYGMSAASMNVLLSSAVRAAGPQKGGTLVQGLQGGESADSLDPALVSTDVPTNTLKHYGDTLVEVSSDGQIVPRLAEEIDSSPDAITWSFKLRKGVEFHNGKTMTPEDVQLSLQRHANEESQSGALGVMRGIRDVRTEGDRIVVELNTPNADLPYLMADYHLIIQPGGGFDNPAGGIGTGPYTIEFNEPGVRLGFRKFANYWDDARGHFDESELFVINDNTARTAALQSGQVQIINRVSPRIAGLLEQSPNLAVKSIAGRAHYVFIMMTDSSPFDNNELRLALKYAVDREEMVEKILRGYGSVGNDMPINASYPLFDESIPQRKYDPEAAGRHYKASGHDGSPIVLRVADTAFPGAIDAASLFQASAKAAGIPLEVKREPNDGYWSEVWNVQPFCASYWVGRPVQDQMFSTAYHSEADWNESRFKRPEFDAMILEARGELDQSKRKEIYGRMGLIIRDEGGSIIPMFNDFIDAVSNKVEGFESDSNGNVMNNMAALKCWFAA